MQRRLQTVNFDPSSPVLTIDDSTGWVYSDGMRCASSGGLSITPVKLATDGITQDWTLTTTPVVLLLFWNGVLQSQGDDYTLNSASIHMVQVPGAGSNLIAVVIA